MVRARVHSGAAEDESTQEGRQDNAGRFWKRLQVHVRCLAKVVSNKQASYHISHYAQRAASTAKIMRGQDSPTTTERFHRFA